MFNGQKHTLLASRNWLFCQFLSNVCDSRMFNFYSAFCSKGKKRRKRKRGRRRKLKKWSLLFSFESKFANRVIPIIKRPDKIKIGTNSITICVYTREKDKCKSIGIRRWAGSLMNRVRIRFGYFDVRGADGRG